MAYKFARRETVARQLAEQGAWPVPTMVQLELAKWPARERGEDTVDRVIALTRVWTIASVGTEVALAAAEACRAQQADAARSHCRKCTNVEL